MEGEVCFDGVARIGKLAKVRYIPSLMPDLWNRGNKKVEFIGSLTTPLRNALVLRPTK
jgi:hypothetical protein